MRTSAGMSLLEVMVASAALVTGIFTVFGAMGMSSQVRTRSKAQGMAIEAIQAEIELLQTMSYNDVVRLVPSGGQLDFDVKGLSPPKGVVDPGHIQREADSTSTRLHLRVTVEWVDAGGPASVVIHYHHINRGG